MTGGKTTLLETVLQQRSVVPLYAVSGIPLTETGGQHLWMSRHAAVEGCQSVPHPYLDFRNEENVLGVIVALQVLSPLSLTAKTPKFLSRLYCWNYLLKRGQKY